MTFQHRMTVRIYQKLARSLDFSIAHVRREHTEANRLTDNYSRKLRFTRRGKAERYAGSRL